MVLAHGLQQKCEWRTGSCVDAVVVGSLDSGDCVSAGVRSCWVRHNVVAMKSRGSCRPLCSAISSVPSLTSPGMQCMYRTVSYLTAPRLTSVLGCLPGKSCL